MVMSLGVSPVLPWPHLTSCSQLLPGSPSQTPPTLPFWTTKEWEVTGRDTHKCKVQPLTATSGRGSQQISPLPSAPGFATLWAGAILLHPPHSPTAGNMERKEKKILLLIFPYFFQTSGQLRLSQSWQSSMGSSATTCGQEAVFTQKWEVPLRREAIFPVKRDHFFGGDSECEGCHPKPEPVEGGIMISFLERGSTVVGKKEHRSRNNLGSSLTMPRFYSILLQHYIHSQGSAAISWGL